jgi:hypothetical protein
VQYRWRPFRGPHDRLSDVLHYARSGWPVAMLVGRFIPRHWVLIVGVDGQTLQCYEPSSGEIRPADIGAIRRSRLTGLGYPHPFAFVLPSSRAATRSATS